MNEIASAINRTDSRSTAPIMMLSAGNGFILQSDKYSRDNAGKSLKKYILLKKGEIAYNHGASKAKQFGCCYELHEEEARIPYVYHCFKINVEEHTPYVALLLNNSKIDKQLKRLVSSSVRMDGLLNISFDDYMSVKLSLPSLSEQIHIASFIEKLEERISYQERLVEALKKYKRGVINKVFNQIEMEWEAVRLSDYTNIMRGSSPRPIDTYITDHLDGVNWIKIGDVSPDALYISHTKEKIKPSGVKKSRQVFRGDLILSNSMSFGRPYILQIDGCIHDGWLLIRDEKGNFDKRFLCYYLSSDKAVTQYKCFAAGSCVNNLNSELVGNVMLSCPPLKTQHHIAALFERLDEKIKNVSNQCDTFLHMKKAFLQKLFI